jgi:hypothetical protein
VWRTDREEKSMSTSTTSRRNRVRGRVAVLAAVVGAFALAPLAATAALYPVWGEQVQVSFDEATLTSTYRMTGGLVGAWTSVLDPARTTFDPVTGAFEGWGTETFEGCVDRHPNGCGPFDPHGTLTFKFKAWQQLDPANGYVLVSGGCVHWVTGGTEGFRGAGGLITMKDTPNADGSVTTTYRGALNLWRPGVWTKSVGGAGGRSPASVGSSQTCGG